MGRAPTDRTRLKERAMAEQAKKVRAVSGHGLGEKSPADGPKRPRAKYSYKSVKRSFADTVLKAEGKSTLGKPIGMDPVTTDRDYDADEIEFMKAMDEYKRTRRRPFPTLSETLVILKSLGYRKVDPS